MNLDINAWKPFQVKRLLEIRNGRGITKEEIDDNSGTFEAVQSGEDNNGVIGKWKVEPVSNEDGKNYWVTDQNNDLNSFYSIFINNTPGQYKYTTYNDPKIQLYCNQKLNWSRTFCVKVRVEAYYNGTNNQIDTDEINVSIDPVKVKLESVEKVGFFDIYSYPTSDVIKTSINPFEIFDARIFKVDFENLVPPNSNISYSVNNIYTLYNANGKFVTTSSPPTSLYTEISRKNNYVGFKIPRNDWKNDANKVTSFDYGVAISSKDGNNVTTTITNKKTFKVVY